MNRIRMQASFTAAALGLALGAVAAEPALSKDEYRTQKNGIAVEYKAGKANCSAFAGNAKDICMAEAKGKERVAKAELEARYKPSSKARFEARAARADADYAVATEKCDDKAGNMKDVCVKEAKAVRVAARANAKARMKTADAQETAGQETAEATAKAQKKSDDAHQVAASDTRDADYTVAHQKCMALAGDVRDGCVAEAKARYGKS